MELKRMSSSPARALTPRLMNSPHFQKVRKASPRARPPSPLMIKGNSAFSLAGRSSALLGIERPLMDLAGENDVVMGAFDSILTAPIAPGAMIGDAVRRPPQPVPIHTPDSAPATPPPPRDESELLRVQNQKLMKRLQEVEREKNEMGDHNAA